MAREYDGAQADRLRGGSQEVKKQKKDNQVLIVIILLAVVTIAAYMPVFRSAFVNFDDDVYVTENPHVQSGLTAEGFKWAFNVGYQGNWHPVTWMSHMLDVSLFGLGPSGPHAVNLLLHLANTLLLLLVLNRMTKSLWKSAFVAALFAVHPMHVESVAWVAERKDVLSTLFWMLTMWAYIRYTETPNLKRYAVMLVFFALGLMSKPTLVTLPFVLLLLDYWPLGRWAGAPWRLVREKLPLFAMSAASCVVTYVAQQGGGGVRTVSELPLFSRIANTPIAYVIYVVKMFWPAKLAVFYPHPVNVTTWHVLAASLLLAAVTALAVGSARRQPYLIVGWLWYLIVLVPMIGLVQVGGQAMADRYSYVPFIGLFIFVTWGISDLFPCSVYTAPRLRVVPILVIIVLAGCSWRQTGYWRDSVALWMHTLAVTTRNDTAHNHLGTAYGKLGRYGEAAEEFKQAIHINANDAEAYFCLGIAYAKLDRYAEAVEEYKNAIRINPDIADVHYNLGNACGRLGRYDEAVDEFKQAIHMRPAYAEAHFGLGVTHLLMGNKTLSMDEYKALTKLDREMANQLFDLINK